jgi:hypothetical protein
LEAEARASGRNLWFSTTSANRDFALREVAPDLRKLERGGYPPGTIDRLTGDLLNGLAGLLFNTPLDMLIEQRLWRDCPALRPAQWLSLHRLAEEAARPTLDPRIAAVTPKKILRSVEALNGAFALFLDRLLPGAAIAAAYARLPSFKLARQLDDLARARLAGPLEPGDEYALVDDFAKLLGLEGWYAWVPDPGHHEITAPSEPSGTTNPDLLREKHPAAVWFLLDALKRFDRLPPDKVRDIAFEIARLGQHGLDYSSADKTYTLSTLPKESFSGLQLMCLMFAGFKRIAPEVDQGMDLEEPYLKALAIFNSPG